MSSKSKGNALEIKAQRELEETGWVVHRVGRKAMYVGAGKMITKGNDIFGCDLVAKAPKTNITRWIQVSTIENKAAKMRTLEKYPWGSADSVEVWCKVAGTSRWRKFLWDIDHSVPGIWKEQEQ